MRRGFTLSILLHIALGLFVFIEMPTLVMPEKEVKLLNVRIASSPSKVIKAKQEAKVKKPKKVYSQQSAAPKYAAKKEAKKQTSNHKTKVLKQTKKKKNKKSKKIIKKKKVKKKKASSKKAKKQSKQQKKQIGKRPEKLDKTNKKKKSIIKSTDKKDRKKKLEEDDFLSTLNFIDEMEEEQKGSIKPEDGEGGDVYEPDQIEMARIRKAVEKRWYKTAGASKLKKRVAVVEVNVDRDGTVNDIKLVESSGYGYFDRSLQRAIRKASPLPIPAEKYEIYKRILLTFKG